jgi:lysozyme family protein
MAAFIKAYQEVLLNEGIYSFDPNDSGGKTCMGISEANWPKWEGWKIVDSLSSTKEMATHPQLQKLVQSFYLQNFWNPIKGDSISSQNIANSIFDFAVNTGVKTSVMLTQRTIGVKDDGIIGKDTLSTLNSFGERLFIAEFKLAKIDRYCDIVDAKPNQIKWLKGWIRRALR